MREPTSMSAAPTTPVTERPQRWDAAFDAAMTDTAVDRLLATAPFSGMDPAKFPRRLPLRDLLKHDTRILRYRRGEIVVRANDYGTSAFMVLSGAARVVRPPGLASAALGRQESTRKNPF